MDLFKTFYKDTVGEDPDEEQCKMMEQALQDVRNGGKSMKPLKLKMKNFGPYKDAEVDFTKFSEAPLFLITGATGSGKTTILMRCVLRFTVGVQPTRIETSSCCAAIL